MYKYLFILFIFFSCKKTEQLPALSQSRILSYKVTNLNDSSIIGAIDENTHTITVYLPFYYGLDVIDPALELSNGAQLASESQPVPVLSDTTTYTVMGADKSTTVYHLKIVIQQDVLKLSSVYAFSPYDGDVFTVAGGISVLANFNTLNFNLVKVTLTGAGNKQYPLEIDPANTRMIVGDAGYGAGPYTVPNTLDSGIYHVSVTLNGLQTDWPAPIHLVYPTTVLATASPEVKQGDTFTVMAVPNSMINNITAAVYEAGGKSYSFSIVSQDRKSVILKVADDFPAGVYGYGYLTTTYSNGSSNSSLLSLTVLSK